jgi:hypothetical protein
MYFDGNIFTLEWSILVGNVDFYKTIKVKGMSLCDKLVGKMLGIQFTDLGTLDCYYGTVSIYLSSRS